MYITQILLHPYFCSFLSSLLALFPFSDHFYPARAVRAGLSDQVWCPYIYMFVSIYIYICLWTKKKFESYFRNRLTFSNIRSRTSHRIYRLALPLRTPEMLSSLSKSRISIFNAHLTLFVRRMTSHNSSVSIVI